MTESAESGCSEGHVLQRKAEVTAIPVQVISRVGA